MGVVHLRYEEKRPESPNTFYRYDRDIYYEEMEEDLNLENKVIYVLAGGYSRSDYDYVNKKKGVELIWRDSLLPKILYPLNFIVSAYSGLIKIYDPFLIKDVVFKYGDLGLVELFIFDSSLEDEFCDKTINDKDASLSKDMVKKDQGYMIYSVDSNNAGSPTGMIKFVSVGKKCPDQLMDVIN